MFGIEKFEQELKERREAAKEKGFDEIADQLWKGSLKTKEQFTKDLKTCFAGVEELLLIRLASDVEIRGSAIVVIEGKVFMITGGKPVSV